MESPEQQAGQNKGGFAAKWGVFTTIGSFGVYVLGYLAIRFQLTALGMGTDLELLDERYFFEGAKFLVYLVATIPVVVLCGLPIVAFAWLMMRLIPAGRVLEARSVAEKCAFSNGGVLRAGRIGLQGIDTICGVVRPGSIEKEGAAARGGVQGAFRIEIKRIPANRRVSVADSIGPESIATDGCVAETCADVIECVRSNADIVIASDHEITSARTHENVGGTGIVDKGTASLENIA